MARRGLSDGARCADRAHGAGGVGALRVLGAPARRPRSGGRLARPRRASQAPDRPARRRARAARRSRRARICAWISRGVPGSRARARRTCPTARSSAVRRRAGWRARSSSTCPRCSTAACAAASGCASRRASSSTPRPRSARRSCSRASTPTTGARRVGEFAIGTNEMVAARRRRHALRREDRRHVPPRARSLVPAARRRQRLGHPLGPGLRPARRRPHRGRRRAAAGRREADGLMDPFDDLYARVIVEHALAVRAGQSVLSRPARRPSRSRARCIAACSRPAGTRRVQLLPDGWIEAKAECAAEGVLGEADRAQARVVRARRLPRHAARARERRAARACRPGARGRRRRRGACARCTSWSTATPAARPPGAARSTRPPPMRRPRGSRSTATASCSGERSSSTSPIPSSPGAPRASCRTAWSRVSATVDELRIVAEGTDLRVRVGRPPLDQRMRPPQPPRRRGLHGPARGRHRGGRDVRDALGLGRPARRGRAAALRGRALRRGRGRERWRLPERRARHGRRRAHARRVRVRAQRRDPGADARHAAGREDRRHGAHGAGLGVLPSPAAPIRARCTGISSATCATAARSTPTAS